MGRAASYVDTLRISTRCPRLAAQRALTAFPRSAWERDIV